MREAALIPGASAGLGLRIAKLFAADKLEVVMVARSKDRLEARAAGLTAAHGITQVVAPELMDPAAPPQRVSEVAKLA